MAFEKVWGLIPFTTHVNKYQANFSLHAAFVHLSVIGPGGTKMMKL